MVNNVDMERVEELKKAIKLRKEGLKATRKAHAEIRRNRTKGVSEGSYNFDKLGGIAKLFNPISNHNLRIEIKTQTDYITALEKTLEEELAPCRFTGVHGDLSEDGNTFFCRKCEYTFTYPTRVLTDNPA